MVVTYHPDRTLGERLERVARQVGKVVVVDNGSRELAVTELRAVAQRVSAHLILNTENLGVGAALNLAVSWAVKQGYRWALLLDQDTDPSPGMVDALVDVVASAGSERVAVVGSNFYDSTMQRPAFALPSAGAAWMERKTVITSGSLLSLSAFRELGGFRDEFFVDGVDDEYCLRARSRGFRVLLAAEPLARHTFGSPSVHRFLWRRVGTTNHPALRRYYMTRNYLVLCIEHARHDPAWVLRTVYSRCLSLLLLVLYERERFQKLRYMGLGAWHGVRRRLGPL